MAEHGVGDTLTHAETGERLRIVGGHEPDLVVTPLDRFESPRRLPYSELAKWGVTPPAGTDNLPEREAAGWARLARQERVNAALLGIADGTVATDGEVRPEDIGLDETGFEKFQRMVSKLRKPKPLPTPEDLINASR